MGIPKQANLELFSKYPAGPKNLITDVQGVTVGQTTKQSENINTGVTVVRPHGGNMFQDKVMAGCSIINGFGKSIGLVQLQELGTIETPIVLTNTMSIGTAFTALNKYMLSENPDIGVSTSTVNCVVTECNDGRLNDIRGMHITEQDVMDALSSTEDEFEEGAVGAGTGMCCLGLKGGIGSASRVLEIDGQEYTVGALVNSNFGGAGNLVIGGKHYNTGKYPNGIPEKDEGSIIIVIATDIPMSERQLNRVAHRAMISLGKTGSVSGNGSGDIAIAFTTANRLPQYSEQELLPIKMFFDDKIDKVFTATIEAVEEAIISSLWHAKTTRGVRNSIYVGLQDFLKAEDSL